jgi:hypothetical protein
MHLAAGRLADNQDLCGRMQLHDRARAERQVLGAQRARAHGGQQGRSTRHHWSET